MRSLSLCMLLVACLLPLLSPAQVLSGKKVKTDFPGAITVRLADNNPVPQHVHFSSQQSFDEKSVFHWLRKTTVLDERTTFEWIDTEADHLGMKHHRYQQFFEGVPVHAGMVILHEQAGRIISINGELFPLEPRSTATGINAQDIVEKALLRYPAQQYAWEVGAAHRAGPLAQRPEGKLVWVSNDLSFKTADFQLAYEMDIYALQPHIHKRIWLDALTGEEIASEVRNCHTDTPGTAQTQFSGERPVTTFENDSGIFESRETGRGNGISTYNCNYTGDYFSAYLFTDDDNDWEPNDGSDEGMECHWATEAYYDLLLNEFGRNSLDDEGFELISYVRYSPDFANAFWNGEFATFGSGATGSVLDQSLASVEVTSHEFTHGLTEFTASLIYAGESGALNESFSDIFGLYLDFKLRPEAGNWTMGEESTSSGEGIRSASNPNFHGNPDCYDGDFWFPGNGVHTNSGVGTHWYYLLSEGGSGVNDLGDAYEIDGVGIDVAAQIAYRNLVFYLTPSSNYADAAYYAQISTADLYGRCSSIWGSNANAWYAVGLGTPVSNELEASFMAQQVHCEVPAEVQFVNTSSYSESAIWDFGDGNTSTEYSPTHIYANAGTYDVSLIATGCEMGEDTLLQQQYIVVDPEAEACDTIVMPENLVAEIEACSGILLDPGGNDVYSDGTYSVFTVTSPVGDPFTLDLLYADIETNFDNLYIYDGPNEMSPLIAIITGNPGTMTYQTSGGSFTLVFSTDGSVVRDGFVLQFQSQGGTIPPTAGFTTSSPTVLVSEPLQLTTTAENASDTWYDMGDGTTLYEESPEYRYTTAGDYTITQYVSNCSELDTAYQQVSVSGSGTLDLMPDTICVTLLSGLELDTTIDLSNSGSGQLYYEWETPGAAWASLSNDQGVLDPGAMTTTGVRFSTGDLLGGDYTQDLTLYAGDEAEPVRHVHLKFTVIGIPEITTTPNPTDFGDVFVTLSHERTFTLENNGTGDLEVTGWSNSNSDYSFDITPSFTVPAQSSMTITATLSPSGLGTINSLLSFETNAGSHDHDLLANGVPAPVALVDPTSICVTLLEGETTTELVTITNSGGSPLTYEWGADGSILVWMHGVDTFQEGQAVLDILAQYLPDTEVIIYGGDDPTELQSLLNQVRVLIMPESEFGSGVVFSDAASVIQTFVNGGGGLIQILGGAGDPINSVGVFSGASSVGSSFNPLLVLDESHPLMDNVITPLEALNYTQSFNFTSPNRTDVLALIDEENAVLSAQDYGTGRAVYIGWDYFEYDENAENVLFNAVNWVSSAGIGGLPPWLDIDPLSGTVGEGEAEESSFQFDATGLEADTFHANVYLLSNDPANPEVLVDVKLIVQAVPIADFSANPLVSCDGLVDFTDRSRNNPTSWAWDFGDGNTSTSQNPSHQYTESGNYTVSLTACNDLGCDTEERLSYIQVELDGTFCDTLIMENNQVETLTNCTGYIVDDGGVDGDYSNNFVSTVHLTPAGAEGLTLYVEDFRLEGCCDYVRIYDGPTTASPLIGAFNGTDLEAGDFFTASGSALTIVFDTDFSVVYSGFVFRYECSGMAPVANFSHDTDMDCENTVNFNNESMHGERYEWDFGDGSISEDEHPTHHFSTAGQHTVRLTAINDFSSSVHEEIINIASVPFELDIDMPAEALVNTLVNFSPAAATALVNFQWEFGPEDSSNSEDATFMYTTPGIYPVVLTATDENGCMVTVTRNIEIKLVDQVDGLNEDEELIYYPNPTRGELMVHLELQNQSELKFLLYNTLGQLVREYPIGDVRTFNGTLDLSAIPAGTYYLQLLSGDGRSIVGKVQKL